jgi:hypothetical protein
MSKQVLSIRSEDLAGALAKGFIPLDLTTARIIAANAIQNLTEGGVPDGNTAGPSLARVNAAVDKALRIVWAAAEVNELQFAPVPLPPDLDDAAAVTVHLMMGKDANANAFAVAVNAFFGVGDANCGGNTANVAQALAEYTVTLAAADVPAPPSFLNVALIPAAHAGDALYLYSAWLEYTRKA